MYEAHCGLAEATLCHAAVQFPVYFCFITIYFFEHFTL
jgi:hypothetical protein